MCSMQCELATISFIHTHISFSLFQFQFHQWYYVARHANRNLYVWYTVYVRYVRPLPNWHRYDLRVPSRFS